MDSLATLAILSTIHLLDVLDITYLKAKSRMDSLATLAISSTIHLLDVLNITYL